MNRYLKIDQGPAVVVNYLLNNNSLFASPNAGNEYIEEFTSWNFPDPERITQQKEPSENLTTYCNGKQD